MIKQPRCPAHAPRRGLARTSTSSISSRSGYAYVDHPSIGAGLLGRFLCDAGYSVGIIAQPDLKRDENLLRLGSPRLFFGITSGNVDSMVNNRTPNLKAASGMSTRPTATCCGPDRVAMFTPTECMSSFPAWRFSWTA